MDDTPLFPQVDITTFDSNPTQHTTDLATLTRGVLVSSHQDAPHTARISPLATLTQPSGTNLPLPMISLPPPPTSLVATTPTPAPLQAAASNHCVTWTVVNTHWH